ncbi:SPOR domain-containing protein [Tsuneonella sp. YG55]|uniref:SPOR domain-containing protein n=1 Tax=Tsuneonella litorea TaxID=2976475 RepID=A0A9X3AMU8_9SPHN|nr:SPOR domain-containing protein [Tsuneonella litorea]
MARATGLAGIAALALSGPAHADVKAGVDAWSAGDYARAVAEWRGPAARGDPDALFNLAQAYRLGRGVAEDLRQAEDFYARAAASGHLKAADNYGLLLFQDGRRQQAMPYVTAAAERGDPRAQYLLGIAHFNGDLVPKDWVRAYALLTLANAAGLPQAATAIGQMDDFVPLAQRQEAQELASTLRGEADARRATQMASADLSDGAPAFPALARPASGAGTTAPAAPFRGPRVPQPVARVALPPSIGAAEAAVAEALRATGTDSPRDAGADFARRDATNAAPDNEAGKETRPGRHSASTAADGPWKLQLGAFSVKSNADRAWAQVAGSAALAGKVKLIDPSGRLTRLLAAGWPDRSAAHSACAALKAGGHACIVTR